MTPEQLEERIRRAMATHAMTPPALPALPRRSRLPIALALAATVALIVSPLLQRREQSSISNAVPPAKESDNPFMPGALMAQISSRPAFAAAVQAARQMRPGRWTYKLGSDDDTDMEIFRYELSHATYEGQDAWRMVTSFFSTSNGWKSNDSLWATVDEFRPLFRIGRAGNGARIEQTYRDHEVMVGTTYNGYTSWKVKALRDSTEDTSNGGMLRMSDLAVTLRALPLAPNWKGSVAIPTENDVRIASIWLNLVVDGEEMVETPAGQFLCWRLALVNPDGSKPHRRGSEQEDGIHFWISKDRGWMVQTSFGVLGKRTSTYTLTEAVEE